MRRWAERAGLRADSWDRDEAKLLRYLYWPTCPSQKHYSSLRGEISMSTMHVNFVWAALSRKAAGPTGPALFDLSRRDVSRLASN